MRFGKMQREGQFIHVIAKTIHDPSSEIYKLHEGAQKFAMLFGRSDEVSGHSGDDGHRLHGAAMMKLKNWDLLTEANRPDHPRWSLFYLGRIR
jgi:hypothetical protein